ncbi:MAG: DNA-binding protein [Spirochaetia bacterium]|jgi:hypothetical protein|nr:DNA-binding protein [Spirochaetia bacterium]
MRTVTLKTDAAFFEKLTKFSMELHITKSEFIRRSVSEYEKFIIREKLKAHILEASLKVRKANMNIMKDFDAAVGDGLENV